MMVLNRINQLFDFDSIYFLKLIGLGISGNLIGLYILEQFTPDLVPPEIIINDGTKDEFWINNGNETKQDAVDAMNNGRYQKAKNLFNEVYNDNNDPEALIYKNNAKIENNTQDYSEIAIPISRENNAKFYTRQMLRGYAQFQNQFNNFDSTDPTLIKLTLVDDEDAPEQAEQVAEWLSQEKQEILAVTGHWSSGTTLEAAKEYQNNQLVLVNAVSTSNNIVKDRDYIFSTMPSNSAFAETMANYINQDLGITKIAVFYTQNSEYSSSLKQELEDAFSGETVNASDKFENIQPTDYLQKMEEVSEQDAEAIVLLPSPKHTYKASQIAEANLARPEQSALIGDVGNLYTVRVRGPLTSFQDMVMPVPWHIKNSNNEEFIREAKKLWEDKGKVTWATAMTYEALSVIGTALDQAGNNPSRKDIQQVLASNFSTEGIDQPIQFDENGRRNNLDDDLIMVKIENLGQGDNRKLRFIPVDNNQ